jgi:hypothetical protein
MASGERKDGLAALAESVEVGEKSGSALLVARARLAYAEALLAAGDAQRARDTAFAVQQWFGSAGNLEAEWRAWLVVSGAQRALGETAESRENAQKAAQLLAALEQKWDSDSYKSYLDRPDIQDRDKELAKLAAAR